MSGRNCIERTNERTEVRKKGETLYTFSFSLSLLPRQFTLGCISSSRLYSREIRSRLSLCQSMPRFVAGLWHTLKLASRRETRISLSLSREKHRRGHSHHRHIDDDGDERWKKREREGANKKNDRTNDYGKYAIIAEERKRGE